jgi:hypothetical protein
LSVENTEITIELSNSLCGCCEGLIKKTPGKIENLPGLSSISYRVGKYLQFRDSMLASLSSTSSSSSLGALSKLSARDPSEDLAIALLDSCALMLDVLTFYQERIANEGFLRTATERRSILELARTIGYELRPPKAACAFLAFTLEESLQSLEKTTIDIGTKVQSVPDDISKMPLIFETTEKIEATRERSNLKPKLIKDQIVDEYSSVIYFDGFNTQLKPGDVILIVKKQQNSSSKEKDNIFFRVVSLVATDSESQKTQVNILGAKDPPILAIAEDTTLSNNVSNKMVDFFDLSAEHILANINEEQKKTFVSTQWSMSDYTVMANKLGLKTPEFFVILNDWANKAIASSLQTTWVYAFRVKAGAFGNNAPSYNILPESVKSVYQNWDASPPLAINKRRIANSKLKIFEFTSDPEVALQSDGQIHIFVRGGDSSLLHRQFDGTSWQNWESIGGKLTSGPAAIAWGSGGKLDVFVRGNDMGLWNNHFNGDVWSGWKPLGGKLTSDPAAVFSDRGGGRIDVFVRGNDNSIYHKWYNASEGWGTSLADHWKPLKKESFDSGPAAAVWPEGKLFVFAFDANREMLYSVYEFNNDTSTSGIDEKTPWSFAGAAGTIYSDPSATSGGNDSLSVYGKDKTNDIYTLRFLGENPGGFLGFPDEWTKIGGSSASGPSAIAYNPSKVNVFFVDTNKSLSYKWYDEMNGDWGSFNDHVETLDAGLPIPAFEDVDYNKNGNLIYLDNAYSSIVPTSNSNESWVIFRKSTDFLKGQICRVLETHEETMVDFALSTKVTGLTLDIEDGSQLSDYAMRKTSVYAQSEELPLAHIPIEDPIKGNSVVLDKAIPYLSIGDLVAITGKIVDKNNKSLDLTCSEIGLVSKIELDVNACTKLTFEHSLNNSYERDCTLNANVARATQGDTRKEIILGGGDPSSLTLQHFLLREKPLTFVSAPTATGAKSTLKISINDVIWNEVPSLYELGPKDRAYITRMDNDFYTHIYFGDGHKGLRPAAGTDNIRAKYRIGSGMEGEMLKPGQLTILMDRPLGVRGVTNPTAPTGAADPESEGRARKNAPVTTLTIDRIVSLKDFENFAISFAGIGKAHAFWIWDGDKKSVYLTVASEAGKNVDPKSDLYKNLIKAIGNYKDPITKFKIGSPKHKLFNIHAGILVSSEFEFQKVKLKVEESLKNKFSFEAREFGQPVAISEVFSTIQNVEGVLAIDINYLYLADVTPQLRKLIPSRVAHWSDTEKKIIPAEIVILNSIPGGGGITIIEMVSPK